MFCRYSTWIGDTDRSVLMERSSRLALWVAVETSGTGLASMSAMIRSQLRVYSARACCGMSEAG